MSFEHVRTGKVTVPLSTRYAYDETSSSEISINTQFRMLVSTVSCRPDVSLVGSSSLDIHTFRQDCLLGIRWSLQVPLQAHVQYANQHTSDHYANQHKLKFLTLSPHDPPCDSFKSF
ncbi:hypothetical protein L596_023526 [Steinernema carpocapsae]|uniref:Uncharacterized protein n=1 Tax=Steinernema carpocapsae TaxID=34508 RepID=A0A4U5MEP5_STECR|nr:hypothetical protein L596_023526 [Steinernema carpocapsae]